MNTKNKNNVEDSHEATRAASNELTTPTGSELGGLMAQYVETKSQLRKGCRHLIYPTYDGFVCGGEMIDASDPYLLEFYNTLGGILRNKGILD